MSDDENPWRDEPFWDQSDDDNPDDETNHQSSDDRDKKSYGASHILVLIDTNPTMFTPCIRFNPNLDDDEIEEDTHRVDEVQDANIQCDLISPFRAALIACERILHSKVHHLATTRSGKRDGVGITLFGTHIIPIQNFFDVEKKSAIDQSAEYDNIANSNYHDDNIPYTCTYSLLPLVPPGVQQILSIRSCIPSKFYSPYFDQSTHDIRSVENELFPDFYTSSSSPDVHQSENVDCNTYDHRQSPLRIALHEANKSFSNSNYVKRAKENETQDSKLVWIFTNQQDPTTGRNDNDYEKQSVINIAKDLDDYGVKIKLWPLPRFCSTTKTLSFFDSSIFYDSITSFNTYNASSGTDDNYRNSSSLSTCFDLNEMLDDIQYQFKKSRKIQTIPLFLPDWKVYNSDKDEINDGSHQSANGMSHVYPNNIQLDIFYPIQVRKRPQHVTINQMTGKETKGETEIFVEETGEKIPKEDFSKRTRTYLEFGGSRIYMKKEEILNIRKQCNATTDIPSLVLFGFKQLPLPVSNAYLEFLSLLTGKAIFAYPNEDLVKGSRRAFASLHASMLRKSVMGVGELLLRKTSSSKLVAIFAQQQDSYHDDNYLKSLQPSGFLMIPLCYKDDIRSTPSNPTPLHDKSMVNAAMDLISNQNITDSITIGDSFENPSLKNFWNYLESVALKTSLIEQDVDSDTVMNVEGIMMSAGAQIEKLKSYLVEDDTEKSKQIGKVTEIV